MPFAQAVEPALSMPGVLCTGNRLGEFRAEVPALVLLLPAAWHGALRMVGRLPEPGRSPSR